MKEYEEHYQISAIFLGLFQCNRILCGLSTKHWFRLLSISTIMDVSWKYSLLKDYGTIFKFTNFNLFPSNQKRYSIFCAGMASATFDLYIFKIAKTWIQLILMVCFSSVFCLVFYSLLVVIQLFWMFYFSVFADFNSCWSQHSNLPIPKVCVTSFFRQEIETIITYSTIDRTEKENTLQKFSN